MVLLAAAVCNKSGKALVSRQFVDMTRARIEGLLAAFPKLMNTGKQHTFVETESVRYVYQPLEKLFVVLITTKASNILEDLETLRLFGRVVPEYSKSLDESDVVANSFQMIFAFDEIVALGYRENVNLAQIQTFIQMDSHEEKVAIAVRETQEREAKAEMKKRQKDLDRQRKDAQKRGVNPYSSGISSSPISAPVQPERVEPAKASVVPKRATGKGLQLGKNKKGDVDKFAAALAREGVAVESVEYGSRKPAASAAAVADPNRENVHLSVEEKLTCIAGRDGGLQNFELTGSLMLYITDPDFTNVVLKINNPNPKGCQMQTHPHMDKNLFQQENTLRFKNTTKRFPTSQDVGILKWRFVTSDESYMPLSINCWPNPTSSGCDVNIEYELQDPDVELYDVSLSIPIPSGVGAPKVTECSGDYKYDNRKNLLSWSLPVIDQSNASGTMEFSIAGHEDDFFPVSVRLYSKQPFSELSVNSVSQLEGGANVKFSTDTVFFADRYEIV